MPRRGENIRKRKDGRWEGRYRVYDVQKRKNISRSIYARTYGEVREKLFREKKLAEERKIKKYKGVPFSFAAEEWLAEIAKEKKPSTIHKYRSVYEKYLLCAIGEILLAELDIGTVKDALEEERLDTLSDSLRRSIASVLNQILAYAAEQYHTDFMRYTWKKQRKDTKPVEVLNQSEQIRLLQYLYRDMDICKFGIILCISTGLRLGEICALKWEDIDPAGKILYVNSTVQRIAADGYATKTILLEGTPKSVYSRREIPIPDELLSLMQSFPKTGRYVLNCKKPMEPRTYQNKFAHYLRAAGIDRKNFHILRHTFATNCIASGADIKSLCEILGHSDVKITLNRYVHPTLETKRCHLNSLTAIYGQYVGTGYQRTACL